MPDTVSSEPFRALAAALKEGGLTTESGRLESILDGAWTTSSELIAELGREVLTIRRQGRRLSSTQKALLKECLRQVRKAWPGFGLFSWLPFGR